MEAAAALRIGFSVFYPSNTTRVALLRDIVETTAPANTLTGRRGANGDESLDNSNEECNTYHSKPASRRQCCTPNMTSLFLSVAVKGLTQEGNVAALVASAFGGKEEIGKGLPDASTQGRQKEFQTGLDEAGEQFYTPELDTMMRMLLLHCINDLERDQRRPSAIAISGSGDKDGSDNQNQNPGNPQSTNQFYTRLLLALQVHVAIFCGDVHGNDPAQRSMASALLLAHAVRLLEGALNFFTRLLEQGSRMEQSTSHDCRPPSEPRSGTIDALQRSFLALIPLLCTSMVAMPAKRDECLSRAAILLPLVLPLVRAVDRHNRHQTAWTAAKPLGEQFLSTSLHHPTCSYRWLAGLEEVLVMFSSDLLCGLLEPEAGSTRGRVPASPYEGCDEQSGEQIEKIEPRQAVDTLLLTSPFLACGPQSFDWAEVEIGGSPQSDNPNFAGALEVSRLDARVARGIEPV